MKDFPPNKLQELLEQLRLRRPKGRAIAAFDADGTLWNTDLGENFFEYQIRHKLIPLPPDPWQHYENLKEKVSHPVAYLWLAQINAGVPVAQVRQWTQESLEHFAPTPVFKEMQTIISELHKLAVETYIVTASIKWAVEPGGKLFGIPNERVLGIETEAVDGVLTDRQKGLITYREGKAQRLLEVTGGVRPYFCAGNTEGDLALLETATDLRLVMAGSPPDNRNYETERKMLNHAHQHGWFSHSYID